MDAKEWADRLDQIEYPAEAIYNLRNEIEADGLIVAYGMSDDLLEFHGAINEEIGAWDGVTVKITNKPSIFNAEENKATAEFNRAQIDSMKTITAVWCPEDENGETWASWDIETDIPHETFEILEEGEVFGRGIVFKMEPERITT